MCECANVGKPMVGGIIHSASGGEGGSDEQNSIQSSAMDDWEANEHQHPSYPMVI